MNKWDIYRVECDRKVKMNDALNLAKKLAALIVDIDQTKMFINVSQTTPVNFAKMVNILGIESAGTMK